jgi:hypothetical protein
MFSSGSSTKRGLAEEGEGLLKPSSSSWSKFLLGKKERERNPSRLLVMYCCYNDIIHHHALNILVGGKIITHHKYHLLLLWERRGSNQIQQV